MSTVVLYCIHTDSKESKTMSRNINMDVTSDHDFPHIPTHITNNIMGDLDEIDFFLNPREFVEACKKICSFLLEQES